MKLSLFILSIMFSSLGCSQAFTGDGDQKFQIGLNLQDNGTGIQATYDYGVGENISFGLSTVYLLSIDEEVDADFLERSDVRLRFNANIGNVLNLSPMFDFYPGLSFGTKNFGGHVGARYFFSDGFGLYSEVGIPFARYDSGDLFPAEELNNQFNFNLGMSFNL